MPVFKTVAFHGHAVRFSPFLGHRLAVATEKNYGSNIGGRQYVLELTPRGIVEVCSFDTYVALYDCAFSEENENVLISGSGDGSVKVWNIAIPPRGNPIRSLKEHVYGVYSVDWNTVRKDCFLSGSLDSMIKLWTVDMLQSVRTFYKEHSYRVYSAIWNPRHSDVFASASDDCEVRIWDVREPDASLVIPAHESRVLSCDWNKYNETMLVTGSMDKSLKVWDIRFPRNYVRRLEGHTDAVRKVKFSPYQENLIGSCSHDMTVCLWDYRAPEAALLFSYKHHFQDVLGIDMSTEGLLASTACDESVVLWQQGMDPLAA